MPILQRKANTKLDLIFLLDQKKHPESIVIASHILSGYQKNPQLFAMILKNMLITILSVKIKSYITLSSWMKSLNTSLSSMHKKNGV